MKSLTAITILIMTLLIHMAIDLLNNELEIDVIFSLNVFDILKQ